MKFNEYAYSTIRVLVRIALLHKLNGSMQVPCKCNHHIIGLLSTKAKNLLKIDKKISR